MHEPDLVQTSSLDISPRGLADALVTFTEREDSDGLSTLAATHLPGAFDDDHRARFWAAMSESGLSTASRALTAALACGLRLDGPPPNEALDLLVRCVELEYDDAVRGLGQLGLRLSPGTAQYNELSNYLFVMGSADVLRALPLIAPLGWNIVGHEDLLARHGDDVEAVRLLLQYGADPNATLSARLVERWSVTNGDTVLDLARSLMYAEVTERREAFALMMPLGAAPLDREIAAQIERLGGQLPDPAEWKSGPTSRNMPLSIWMLDRVVWPSGTVLATPDLDAYPSVVDFRPGRLDAWSTRDGWDVADKWRDGTLWLWATSEVQDMIAISFGQRGNLSWHRLDHDRANDLAAPRDLAKVLARLERVT